MPTTPADGQIAEQPAIDAGQLCQFRIAVTGFGASDLNGGAGFGDPYRVGCSGHIGNRNAALQNMATGSFRDGVDGDGRVVPVKMVAQADRDARRAMGRSWDGAWGNLLMRTLGRGADD